MDNHDKLIAMLKSRKASTRYEACEELRVLAQIPDEARAALRAATNDPDRLVRDAAVRALQAHEKPQDLPLQAPPATVPSGPRLSLALLGAATMVLVVLLCGVIVTSQESAYVRLSWGFLLFLYAYPLYLAPYYGAGWLLFALAYLVPFIVAFSLPARINRTLVGTLAVLSGFAAGLIYCMGFILSSVYWS
jgi:hypothetical protein